MEKMGNIQIRKIEINRSLSISKTALIFLVWAMLFCTDSALVNTNSNRIWARVAWIVILFLTAYYFPKAKFSKLNKYLLIGFTITIGASMVINDIIDVNYIQRIVIIWLSCAIASTIDYQTLMRVYIKAMRLIAIVSLIGIAFKPLFLALPFPIMHCGTNNFVNLILTNISVASTRNYGPFWEPGAFQLYLNWAIFYELRNKNLFNLKDILLFIVTIISTRSTGGILILFLILTYHVVFCKNSNNKNHLWIKAVVASVILIGIAVLIYVPDLTQMIFGKLFALQETPDDINSSNISAYTRYYSTHASIEAIKASPVFGLGITGIKDFAMRTYALTSNTNSILAFPASFGILSGVLYITLFLRAINNISTTKLGAIILFFIFIAMFCTENMLVSLMFWTFLFYESNGK